MAPEVEARFARIEALLHAGVERGNQMEIRFNRRMDRAEKRMERAEQRMEKFDQRTEKFEQRMEKFEQRMEKFELVMEKFDRRLEATRKVVETGMRLMVRLNVTVNKLAESQKAMMDSLRTGGNGHARGPGRQ
jgi:predicted  nucleic acid-binding Zn-ribbon protein